MVPAQTSALALLGRGGTEGAVRRCGEGGEGLGKRGGEGAFAEIGVTWEGEGICGKGEEEGSEGGEVEVGGNGELGGCIGWV